MNKQKKQKEKSMLDIIYEIAVRRGFLFPTADIHGGAAGEYDYGPLGVLLKRKVETLWRKMFVYEEENVYEIDGCVILPYRVLKASGHVDHFVEPSIKCKKCGEVFRLDHLIEEKLGINVEGLSLEKLKEIVKNSKLTCPNCGAILDPESVRWFNTMFQLQIGATGKQTGFLRPETAQNIFCNFKYIVSSTGATLPFGVAQIGKSFRNEISPRQFLYRLREFHQMELEWFGTKELFENDPRYERVKDITINFVLAKGENAGKTIKISIKELVEKKMVPNKTFAYFLGRIYLFYRKLGIPDDVIRFREIPDNERPFYSQCNVDVEIKFSIGWKEVEGTAYRTNYDLSVHSKYSGEKLTIPYQGKSIIPEVIEISFGIERSILAILEHCYRPPGYDRDWQWFDFPPWIAPISAAIFPLVKRDPKLVETARKIFLNLRESGFDVIYDDKGSIGKRYRKADEIGIPFCITIDRQTLEDNTVTIRDRNSRKQIRVKISELKTILIRLINGEINFSELEKTQAT